MDIVEIFEQRKSSYIHESGIWGNLLEWDALNMVKNLILSKLLRMCASKKDSVQYKDSVIDVYGYVKCLKEYIRPQPEAFCLKDQIPTYFTYDFLKLDHITGEYKYKKELFEILDLLARSIVQNSGRVGEYIEKLELNIPDIQKRLYGGI